MARKKKSRSKSSSSNQPKGKTDAYTGMLGISLLALIGGAVLIYLDYQKYDFGKAKPQQVNIDPYGTQSPTKPDPAPGGAGGNAGVPPGGPGGPGPGGMAGKGGMGGMMGGGPAPMP